jgi:alanyl-tRNA synthetase
MTKRLYFDEPYRTEFEATVIRSVEWQGKPGLTLDQTCFYPASGGQGCDKGFLNDVPVVDVLEHEGEILHLTADRIEAQRVSGRISWNRRFNFMQQHSGQHVLSQSVLQVLHADTLSSHLGEETSTIEIAKGDLANEEVWAAEEFANKIVFENRTIKSYFVSTDQLEKIPLRKIPSQKEQLRIVEIESLDVSACGGTHCRRTGEIGLIKVGRWERIRKNVRLHFLCGNKVEKGQLVFACSAGLAWRMNDLLRNACTILGGSGGGSSGLAFGSGPLVQKVEEAIQRTYERILKG